MRRITILIIFILVSICSHGEPYINKTIKLEGEYSKNIHDTGRETKFGITEKTARINGYEGEMIDLPLELAHNIYKTEYWNNLRLGRIKNKELSHSIFDFSVNVGIRVAAKSIQEAINYAYKDNILVVDGFIGNKTINAINNFNDVDRIIIIFEMIKCSKYVELVRKYPNNVSFIYGWSKRSVVYNAVKED